MMKLNSNKILIFTKKGVVVEDINNIFFIKSKGNFCTFKVFNGNMIDSTKSLKHYEEKYTEVSFLRIHKSYLVNFDHVVEFDFYENSYVKLKDGSCLKIAIRKRSYIKKLFIGKN